VLSTRSEPRAPDAHANYLLLRRQHLVQALYKLGPRVLFQLLCELEQHADLPDLDRRLERYASLEREVLTAVGADRMPASPIRMAQR
jgi:hypothetical protein